MTRTKSEKQTDFFNRNAKVSDSLQELYDLRVESKGEAGVREITEDAVDAGVWPLIDAREATIMVHIPDTQAWMNETDSSGIQRGYKTPQGTRQPWHLASQSVLEFDIESDATQIVGDRRSVRRKIVALIGRYPSATVNVPAWIWSDEDDAWLRKSLRLSDPQQAAAD